MEVSSSTEDKSKIVVTTCEDPCTTMISTESALDVTSPLNEGLYSCCNQVVFQVPGN